MTPRGGACEIVSVCPATTTSPAARPPISTAEAGIAEGTCALAGSARTSAFVPARRPQRSSVRSETVSVTFFAPGLPGESTAEAWLAGFDAAALATATSEIAVARMNVGTREVTSSPSLDALDQTPPGGHSKGGFSYRKNAMSHFEEHHARSDVTPQGDVANARADYVNGINADDGVIYSVRTFDEDTSLFVAPGWDAFSGGRAADALPAE